MKLQRTAAAPKPNEAARPLWMVRLAGSQVEMGRQHGEFAAAVGAHDSLDYFPQMPERALLHGMPAGVAAAAGVVVGAAKEAWLRRLDRDRPSELRDRTRAFTQAMGLPADHARYFGVMDVLQNSIGAIARAGIGPFAEAAKALEQRLAVPACSSLCAWGNATVDGELRFARNFDFLGIGVWDRSPAMVTCSPDDGQRYSFLAARGIDAPVVTVWNEAGIVIAPHTRFHRDVGWRGTTIIDLVHSIARRAETLADAVTIARELGASSSWGVFVASSREKNALVLETTSKNVEVIEPTSGANYMVCANRYRHASMQAGQVAASAAWRLQSEKRVRRLRQLLEATLASGSKLDAKAMAAMLSDRHDIDAPKLVRRAGGIVAQATNVHAAVVEPVGKSVYIGVDSSPSCEGNWARVEFSWDGPAVGTWELPITPMGTTITSLPAWMQPHDAAVNALREATAIDEFTHDVDATSAALERAVSEAPDDPSLRALAMWTQLRRSDAAATATALHHAHAGLAVETEPYRRGQFMRWGALIAEALGQDDQATAWRRELSALVGDGVDELQRDAARDVAKAAAPLAKLARRVGIRPRVHTPAVNMLMLDAT